MTGWVGVRAAALERVADAARVVYLVHEAELYSRSCPLRDKVWCDLLNALDALADAPDAATAAIRTRMCT